MRVWREVWSVLQDELTAIMSTSLEEARLPELWKKSCIIPLRKAAKDDHTSVKSYRPISLLQTVHCGGFLLSRLLSARMLVGYPEPLLCPLCDDPRRVKVLLESPAFQVELSTIVLGWPVGISSG